MEKADVTHIWPEQPWGGQAAGDKGSWLTGRSPFLFLELADRLEVGSVLALRAACSH